MGFRQPLRDGESLGKFNSYIATYEPKLCGLVEIVFPGGVAEGLKAHHPLVVLPWSAVFIIILKILII